MSAAVKYRMTPAQLRVARMRAIGYSAFDGLWLGLIVTRPTWHHGWSAIFDCAAFGIYFSVAWSAWRNIILNADRPTRPRGL